MAGICTCLSFNYDLHDLLATRQFVIFEGAAIYRHHTLVREAQVCTYTNSTIQQYIAYALKYSIPVGNIIRLSDGMRYYYRKLN
jgi:hypothetical protein